MTTESEHLAELRAVIGEILGCRGAEKQTQQILALIAEQVKALQDFKDFTHRTLDAIGVPVDLPDSEHTKAGCRIGGRLEWVSERLTDLVVQRHRLAEAERMLEVRKAMFDEAVTELGRFVAAYPRPR